MGELQQVLQDEELARKMQDEDERLRRVKDRLATVFTCHQSWKTNI